MVDTTRASLNFAEVVYAKTTTDVNRASLNFAEVVYAKTTIDVNRATLNFAEVVYSEAPSLALLNGIHQINIITT